MHSVESLSVAKNTALFKASRFEYLSKNALAFSCSKVYIGGTTENCEEKRALRRGFYVTADKALFELLLLKTTKVR